MKQINSEDKANFNWKCNLSALVILFFLHSTCNATDGWQIDCRTPPDEKISCTLDYQVSSENTVVDVVSFANEGKSNLFCIEIFGSDVNDGARIRIPRNDSFKVREKLCSAESEALVKQMLAGEKIVINTSTSTKLHIQYIVDLHEFPKIFEEWKVKESQRIASTKGVEQASRPIKAPQVIYPYTPDEKEKIALQESVGKELRDPYSAKFHEFTAQKKVYDDYTSVTACGYVNAKNAYGAYVGRSKYRAFITRENGEDPKPAAASLEGGKRGAMVVDMLCTEDGIRFGD